MYEDKFMILAVNESKKCAKSQDVPVGCVIVQNGNVISKSHNQKEMKKTSTAHAEVLAIDKACKKLQCANLSGCDMYITFEPCLMCAGAIVGARIQNVYFGAYDKRFGTVDKLAQFATNHHTHFEGGYHIEECQNMLSNFFREIRKNDSNHD